MCPFLVSGNICGDKDVIVVDRYYILHIIYLRYKVN